MTGRLGEDELRAVQNVFARKSLSRYSWENKEGECDLFEEELSKKFDVAHSLFVTSGTNALIGALSGLGIGPGDEVIVPTYTYIATPGAVLAAGAIPVFANIDSSLTIDPEEIEKRVTPRTKAVIVVHMSGLACNMRRILELAEKRNLYVIEDACQAMGGEFEGKKLGTIGAAGAYSFNTFKILTCGEGGAMVTNKRELFERAYINHDMGMNFRPYLERLREPVFMGKSMRMSDVSGAIMRVQLSKLNGILQNFREKKDIYQKVLSGSRAHFPLNHSPGRECPIAVPLSFGSSDECERALAKVRELGVYCEQLSRYFRHVFSFWTPILKRQVGHHPQTNPFFSRPEFQYNLDEYSSSAEILERSMIFFVNLAAEKTSGETEHLAIEIQKKINSI
jgi:dTDP-4-amino-4,6-dideoxygalactose transaminase